MRSFSLVFSVLLAVINGHGASAQSGVAKKPAGDSVLSVRTSSRADSVSRRRAAKGYSADSSGRRAQAGHPSDSLPHFSPSVRHAKGDSMLTDAGGVWQKYRVQPGRSYAINTRSLLTKKKKANLEYNLADFYLYRNGELVKPPKHINLDFFPTGCICFKADDTLLLNSGLGKAVGVGVGIKIFRGRFSGSLHANTREEAVYKEYRSDTAYLHTLTQIPETQSLKLSRAPAFAPNEVITGEYEAVYKAFWEKGGNAKDELRQYTVRIIFRCRVTGGIDSMKSLMSVNKH